MYTTKVQIVQKDTSQKEEDTVADTWEGYEVKLEYPSKIDVSEEELPQELEKSFQTVNRLYLTEVNQAKLAKRELNHLNVWRTFLQNHYMEFLGVGLLIQILIATAWNTSPLEKVIYPSTDDHFQNGLNKFRDIVFICCFEVKWLWQFHECEWRLIRILNCWCSKICLVFRYV